MQSIHIQIEGELVQQKCEWIQLKMGNPKFARRQIPWFPGMFWLRGLQATRLAPPIEAQRVHNLSIGDMPKLEAWAAELSA